MQTPCFVASPLAGDDMVHLHVDHLRGETTPVVIVRVPDAVHAPKLLGGTILADVTAFADRAGLHAIRLFEPDVISALHLLDDCAFARAGVIMDDHGDGGEGDFRFGGNAVVGLGHVEPRYGMCGESGNPALALKIVTWIKLLSSNQH